MMAGRRKRRPTHFVSLLVSLFASLLVSLGVSSDGRARSGVYGARSSATRRSDDVPSPTCALGGIGRGAEHGGVADACAGKRLARARSTPGESASRGTISAG